MVVKSLKELNELRDRHKKNITNIDDKDKSKNIRIAICGGTGCNASGTHEVKEALKDEIKKLNLEKKVQVVTTGCFGFCEKGPILKVLPDNIFYIEIDEKKARRIINEHIVNGQIVEEYLYREPLSKEIHYKQDEMPFYKKQKRIALRNCGEIEPENIYEFIAMDGYQALAKVLTELHQDETINILKKSGLRGRGGGGFPTGLKWEMTKKSQNDKKYVICNADEGDPGAFMDRSILEGDPHSVLEAMAICGYCIGADKGYFYIRAEYPLAINRLKIAIQQAYELGLLGKNILGTGFNFDISLKYGAGAFICGEETALINSMEGGRGEPTVKPPYPAQVGLWKKPTNINNVETLANIPEIILKGADWFSSIGTEKSKGTKVFALAGKINNVGLVEVPMGITLREIIYDLGGGIRGNKKFKAVQTGGPSGGCIPAEFLDIPIDYESLTSIGSMMGSGGMIVMDEDDCMVNISKFYLEFSCEESCGRCTACRIGNTRLLEILTEITEGNGTKEHLEALKELGEIVKDSSLCGLGQTSPNPVLSTLKFFYNEYLAHVENKTCPAGVCSKLSKYHILPDKCVGCTACAKVCPTNAISGKVRDTHIVDKDKCIACGACMATCKFNAVAR